MTKKKTKKFLISFVTIFIFLLAYNFLVNKYEKLGHWLDDNIWYRFDAAKRIIIYEKSFADRFYNSYNQKYLPQTLFLDLDYKAIKLDFPFWGNVCLKFPLPDPPLKNEYIHL